MSILGLPLKREMCRSALLCLFEDKGFRLQHSGATFCSATVDKLETPAGRAN